MPDSSSTRYDKLVQWFKQQRFFAIVLFVGVSIIALGALADAGTKIRDFLSVWVTADYEATAEMPGVENREPKTQPSRFDEQNLSLEGIESVLANFRCVGKESNLEEAKRMMATLQPNRTYRRDAYSISGVFGNSPDPSLNSEVTIWKNTYDKPQVYGVRFGVADSTYWLCNDSYFELVKQNERLLFVQPPNTAPCQ